MTSAWTAIALPPPSARGVRRAGRVRRRAGSSRGTPWHRLAAFREAVPNICLQMLLRGRNTVGYTPLSHRGHRRVREDIARTGIDVFRIFDALNDVDQMRPAIDAVRATGTTVAEVCLCYTGDLSDSAERPYTLDHYLKLSERIVDAGAHVLSEGGLDFDQLPRRNLYGF